MGRRDRRTAESLLEVVIEHLLKLVFSPARTPRRGWRRTVLRTRAQLRTMLSGDRHAHLEEGLDRYYARARRRAGRSLRAHGETGAADALPTRCPWTLVQILDEGFWPERER